METYHWRIPVMLENPGGLRRKGEPVTVKLNLSGHPARPEELWLCSSRKTVIPCQLCDCELRDGLIITGSLVFITDMDQPADLYYLCAGSRPEDISSEGIRQLTPKLPDGVRRLDTGCYELELCRGTGDGTSSGKWGIRYFASKAEGRNLIRNCSNAIGGFYGPFFTPANGLINPPEHVIADFEPEVEGPLYCRYRLSGKIPDGLDERLRDKSFSIIWEFFYGSPWFRRRYEVDHFSTFVDGMPVEDKITVGDEYESGQGHTVFHRFAASGETLYREGDPYADILAAAVRRILSQPDAGQSEKAGRYRAAVGPDINKVSWDFFWRLFCVKEGILDRDEIRRHVDEIIPLAHRTVHGSPRYGQIKRSFSGVDVNACPQQTIFPLCARKTAEINDETGYTMVWCTEKPVARYQIVQRKDSGWVNWGTNGENEYPELPTGSLITTAYGQFSDWECEAGAMESPIVARQGMISREK